MMSPAFAGTTKIVHCSAVYPFAASAANQQQNHPRSLQSSNGPLKDRWTDPAEAHAPLFRLFYQVEIRHYQFPSSKFRNPLTAANARNGTTRLWQ
jgi:hypothetical protein